MLWQNRHRPSSASCYRKQQGGTRNLCDLPLAACSSYSLQVVELPLKISQTAAVMEVVHSAIGLVRSPLGITGEQQTGKGGGALRVCVDGGH